MPIAREFPKVGLNRVQWVDIDSTVDSVCGTQEGAAKGYNPRKRRTLLPSSIGFSGGEQRNPASLV